MSHPQILKWDSSGQPQKWINWKKAILHHVTGEVSWSLGEVEFTFHGGINDVTGKQSSITTASIIAVRGHSKKLTKERTIPALNNAQLFKRDRYTCAYCGHTFHDSKLSRDHIIPTSRGGTDTWMNVVTACKKDNHKKADKTLEQLGWKLKYAPYIPSHAEDLILKGRNVLQDQMDFLLNFVSDDSPLKKELKNANSEWKVSDSFWQSFKI